MGPVTNSARFPQSLSLELVGTTLFDALGEWFGMREFRGCMFIKARTEYQEKDHPIDVQSAEHKRVLDDHFRKLAKAADATGPEGPPASFCDSWRAR